MTTKRLALRRFTIEDEALLLRLNSDERVMRYIGGVMSPEKNAEALRTRILAYYDENPGLGTWATIDRATGECVGFHILNKVQGLGDVQVGYRLFPEHWGKGYATEMSIALLRYGFAQLGFPVITANAHRENAASIHVLEKCGLRRKEDRVIDHPSYANIGPVAWFERPSGEWLDEFKGSLAA